MTGGGRARTRLVRVWAFFAAALALVLLGAAVAGAAAETRPAAAGAQVAPLTPVGPLARAAVDPDKVTVEVKRAAYAEPVNNPNAISVDVIVRDENGNPPKVNYGVLTSTFLTHQVPPEKSTPSPCTQPRYTTNPEFDQGMYRCSYVVDKPDVWTFEAYVNKLGTGEKVVQLAKAQGTFPVSDAVVLGGQSKGLRYVVEGSTFEVFLLQAHLATASIWLLMVTVMAFLALPRLRRMLSVLTLHTLEVRRGFLNSVMWAMFMSVVGTGIYLLTTQTAYDAPFSPSAWSNITKLPYGTTYFTALYLKILIFVVMAAASVVLMTEAARQARLAGDLGPGGYDEDLDMWGRESLHLDNLHHDDDVVRVPRDAGTQTTAVKAQPRAATEDKGVSEKTLWACVIAVAAGMGVIGVLVTVLKYTHELIEIVVAAKIIDGA